MSFLKYYWENSKKLVFFSVAMFFMLIYFLHVDHDPKAFWWCLLVLVSINLIRFFGLLISRR